MSLCWAVQKDCLIWPACNSGEYSVKTGYKLLCEEENSSVALSSDRLKQDLFWKRIWKQRIPNKIKLFLWQVCSNALPTKENLKKRKILDDAKCSACHSTQESTFSPHLDSLFQLDPNRAPSNSGCTGTNPLGWVVDRQSRVVCNCGLAYLEPQKSAATK